MVHAHTVAWGSGWVVGGWLRLVGAVGLVAVGLMAGCDLPGITDATPGGCDGSPCDNGNLCTSDICVVGSNGEAVCSNDPIDCGDQFCNPAALEISSACVDCLSDSDCDDGVLCNGEETCDSNGLICVVSSSPNCAFGCNVDTDACNECGDVSVCVSIGFCDGSPTCTNGVCGTDGIDPCVANTNGLNMCDADSESCVGCLIDSDCDSGEICNTDTNECVVGTCDVDSDCGNLEICSNGVCVAIECREDFDCDDGFFCTGTSTCDTNSFTCVVGGEPCGAGETCDDDLDTCGAASAQTFTLTTGTNSGAAFVGGAGDDFFDAQLFLSGGGTFIQTLNIADSLDGGAGTDVLTAQFNPTAAATLTPASLANIEVFNFEVASGFAQTVDMIHADQVTTINFNNSTRGGGNLQITNLQVVPTAFGMTNSTENFNVSIDSTKMTGTANACTLTLNGVIVVGGGSFVTIQPSVVGSGYETITINSIGGIANEIVRLTDGVGNSLSRLIFTGSQDVTIDAVVLDSTVKTIDASAATGNVTLNVTVAGSDVTFTGGSGDDSLDISGTYTTGDTIDGGDGTDTLRLAAAEAQVGSTVQTKVTNIETILCDSITSGDIDVSMFGARNLHLTVGAASNSNFTLPSGGILTADTVDPVGSHTFAVAGTDTTSDTLTLAFNDTGWTDITLSTFETLNIISEVSDNNAIVGTTTMSDTASVETINISGSRNMGLWGVVTADVIDASALTGRLEMQSTSSRTMTIRGGVAGDTLIGSDMADIIDGRDGNDVIYGRAGADLLTGGAGNDKFNGDTSNTDESVADTIIDFDAGTSTTTNDLLMYDISSIEAADTGHTIVDLVDTSANSAATSQGTFVQLGADGATVANADIVGLIGDYTNAADALANKTSWTITYGAALTDNDAFLVVYTSASNIRIAVAVSAGATLSNSDGIDTLFDILILQNVSLSNLDSGDFTSQL